MAIRKRRFCPFESKILKKSNVNIIETISNIGQSGIDLKPTFNVLNDTLIEYKL